MEHQIFGKHVLVISHWRSGTHLTLDLIRNNSMQYILPYISLRKHNLDNNYQSENTFQIFNSPSIFKSHTDINYNSFYNSSNTTEILNRLIKQAKIIYVYREGKDVLTSLYHYLDCNNEMKKQSFSEFLQSKNDLDNRAIHANKNRIEYLHYHTKHWLDLLSNKNNALIVKYEDIINLYDITVHKVLGFLGEEIIDKALVDIRMSNKKRNKGKIITSSKFRKGTIGDYMNYFSTNDYIKYNNIVSEYSGDL